MIPKKLQDIYLNIKAQIKSIYQVDYTTSNDDPNFERRNIRFAFVNDTLEFANQPAYYSLPDEVKAHLETRKAEELSRVTNNQIMLGAGAGALVLLLGIGGFVIARRKKQVLLSSKKLPPILSKMKLTWNIPSPSTPQKRNLS